MEGLETTILTGMHGERMMMVLNTTLPGYTVPMHTHPHDQIGVVYKGKAKLRIGKEERIVQQGDFFVSRAIFHTVTPVLVMNPL